MKTGRTLSALATEIERQQNVKRDFVADTGRISLAEIIDETEKSQVRLRLNTKEAMDLNINSMFHDQLAGDLSIPKTYYQRMLQVEPTMLVRDVNRWLERAPTDLGNGKPVKRMVRTLDGTARAFLSDKYRRLDNYDLMLAVLPLLQDTGLNIESCEVTEKKLYLKAVNPKREGEIKPGDVVQAGISISNSEVGNGMLSIQPLLFRLVCRNGLIANDYSMKGRHVGGRLGTDGEARELYTDATRNLDDAAYWSKVRDVTNSALNDTKMFDKLVENAQEAAGQVIERKPEDVVELTAKKFTLNEGERTGILAQLIAGRDMTRWGLVNAITAAAQGVDSYDRSTELERLGGEVMELGATDWKKIAGVAA